MDPLESHIGRRKAERSILMLDPLLLDKEGRVVARVADLSMDGAMLYARGEPFAAGTEIAGWLDAPALGDLDEEFVAVWMTVAWSVVEPRGWFKCGCSFDASDSESRARLEKMLFALKAPQRKPNRPPMPE